MQFQKYLAFDSGKVGSTKPYTTVA